MAKWYNKLQYLSMLLMAAALPVGWHYGLWIAAGMATVSFFKLVAERKIGNPALGRTLRWILTGAIVYWIVLAVSMLWTEDLDAGGKVLLLKAVLLIFPLCFLLTDTTYLKRSHFRGLGYAFTFSMCAVFLFFAVKAAVSLYHGSPLNSVSGDYFDPRHHAYTAFYATIALVFVYHELTTHWHAMRAWWRGLWMVAMLLMVCYIVVVNSRAGILAVVLVGACYIVQQTVRYHRWWLAFVSVAVLLGGVVFVPLVFPGYQNRIVVTVQRIQENGEKGDKRIPIIRASADAFRQQPVWGYGVGDYYQVFADYCRHTGNKVASNTHNQYTESLLAAGILGLLGLLFFMMGPVCVAVRRASRYRFLIVLLTGVVMFNLLFESMLERQMGLLSIGCLMTVMTLILSVKENKFCRVGKS